MSARRYHHKSKTGCVNCKQRKIKCDEARGGCKNCQERRYSCNLGVSTLTPTTTPDATRVRVLAQKSNFLLRSLSVPHFASTLLKQGALEQTSGLMRPHVARLLYHFELNTVTSMGYGTAAQQAWCRAIPDLMRKNNFVVHGVLAVTALHLSTTSDRAEVRDKYRNMAAAELNTGLVRYMTEIRKVTSNNAEALFAFSTAISLFASFQATDECQSLLGLMHVEHPTATPVQSIILKAVQTTCRGIRTLRGAQVILVPGWAKLRDGPLRSVVQRESWSTAISVAKAHFNEERQLRDLELMWSNQHRAYEDYFDTLRQAWQSLHGSFALVWSLIGTSHSDPLSIGPCFDWTSIFHWPVQCSLAYICLLEQQCIEAWVLLAHYAILQAEVKGLWWLERSTASIVTAAALVIGTNNWEWIAWPVASIGIDLESLRPLALPRLKICP